MTPPIFGAEPRCGQQCRFLHSTAPVGGSRSALAITYPETIIHSRSLCDAQVSPGSRWGRVGCAHHCPFVALSRAAFCISSTAASTAGRAWARDNASGGSASPSKTGIWHVAPQRQLRRWPPPRSNLPQNAATTPERCRSAVPPPRPHPRPRPRRRPQQVVPAKQTAARRRRTGCRYPQSCAAKGAALPPARASLQGYAPAAVATTAQGPPTEKGRSASDARHWPSLRCASAHLARIV